jgi:hypothetical protein
MAVLARTSSNLPYRMIYKRTLGNLLKLSNVAVELLALLLREVRDSNLGPQIGYPDVFHGLSQSLHENVG